jgi:hypothetical protein
MDLPQHAEVFYFYGQALKKKTPKKYNTKEFYFSE